MKYEFKLRSNFEHDVPVIILDGDVTAESDAEIKDAYFKLLEEGADTVLFDFSGTRYINSAGVATLLALVNKAVQQSHAIVFVALSPHFRKVVEIIGMVDFIRVVDTVDEWLAIAKKKADS